MAKSTKNKSATPPVCNLILPVETDHLTAIAQKLVDDEKLTVAEVNGGRLTKDQVGKLWGIWDESLNDGEGGYPDGSMNEALYAGKPASKVPSVPAAHQPVLLIAAALLGMEFAGRGQASRNTEQPANWPNHLPRWEAGYGIRTSFGRAMAPKDVRRNVDDGDHLVTIGKSDYVIGDAIHALHGSKGQNTYGFNGRCLKRLAFRGREREIANIVFQINNSVGAVPWTGDRTKGTPLVMLPNMVATAGHLSRSGKVLTDAQIATAVEKGDTKGITFKTLSEPIVGNKVSRAALVAAVKKSMNTRATHDDDGKSAWDHFLASYSGDVEAAGDAIWTNALVQTRTNPIVSNCFGLRNAVLDMPLAVVFGDSKDDKGITCIIGRRCGDSLTADSLEALREAEAEKPKPKPKAKPKAEKPKAEKPVTDAAELTDTADDFADAKLETAGQEDIAVESVESVESVTTD